MLARLALSAAAVWLGYAWSAHLATPLCVHRGPRDAGLRVALTFDDGPDPEWTPRVLDTLARDGVRATFFLVGERAVRAATTVRAIAGAGHEVGSHGWSHRSFWLCGPRRTAMEIDRTQAMLAGITGCAPRFFRPPWGMVNAAMFPMLRTRGLRPVFWSIQPEGRRPAPADAQAAYVVARAHPGAIVDLHDAEGAPGAPARVLAALPAMIAGLRDRGYAFTTVGELLAA
ncbi:MAG TPA: polysaccharide deacetylase family protein [Dongiaceae bacterium]|nr:polysaccharide deacetylase family protein [Dongiaceae bacterium]